MTTAEAAAGGTRFRVRVPATSANLGPGFDSLGLALDLWDTYTVTARAAGEPGSVACVVHVEGEGAGTVAADEENLVVAAMRAAAAELGRELGPFSLHCDNRIPHSRGLGSSAAAIAGGVLAGRALAGAPRDLPAELALAARLEGHPDNVAAALFGGLTIAWRDDEDGPDGSRPARAVGLAPLPLRVRAYVPGSAMSTTVARGLLPAVVTHVEAAQGAGRAALLIAALTRPGLADRRAALFAGTRDGLHQQARGTAMPETAQLLATLRSARVAAVFSGSGPAVLALDTVDGEATWARVTAPAGWSVLDLGIAAGASALADAQHAGRELDIGHDVFDTPHSTPGNNRARGSL